jgi:hypothetical protein
MPIPLCPEDREVEANGTATFAYTDPFINTADAEAANDDASSLAERPNVRVFSRVEIEQNPLNPDTLVAYFSSPVTTSSTSPGGNDRRRLQRRVHGSKHTGSRQDKTFVFVITKGRNKMGVAAITVRRGSP